MMRDTRQVRREMLLDPVDLHIYGSNLDLHTARKHADARAADLVSRPMLLAWYERRSGEHSPGVVCGCGDDVPSWVVYAQSRGGNVSIFINDGEYVFLYRGT